MLLPRHKCSSYWQSLLKCEVFIIFIYFILSYTCIWKAISHCGFNFHFPNFECFSVCLFYIYSPLVICHICLMYINRKIKVLFYLYPCIYHFCCSLIHHVHLRFNLLPVFFSLQLLTFTFLPLCWSATTNALTFGLYGNDCILS